MAIVFEADYHDIFVQGVITYTRRPLSLLIDGKTYYQFKIQFLFYHFKFSRPAEAEFHIKKKKALSRKGKTSFKNTLELIN